MDLGIFVAGIAVEPVDGNWRSVVDIEGLNMAVEGGSVCRVVMGSWAAGNQ